MTESPPIFITSRFRSGSTMMWNLYDQTLGFRAFYEPCHDNLLAHIAYTAPKATHRGVKSYWDAYHPIQDLIEQRHRPAFGLSRLVLEADDDWPELEAYLRTIIDSTDPATAVLQFNRMDLRLPWLKAKFPEARIIHLERPLRDVWHSMTRPLPDDWIDDPNESHIYDLFEWCCSLAPSLPFLADPGIRSLYERHAYLWLMSARVGAACADQHLDYRRDFQDSRDGVEMLVAAGLFPEDRADMARQLIIPTIAAEERFAPAEGFDAVERRCGDRLAALGLLEWLGRRPLAEIRSAHADAWAKERHPAAVLIEPLLLAYSRQRNEVTRLLDLARSQLTS